MNKLFYMSIGLTTLVFMVSGLLGSTTGRGSSLVALLVGIAWGVGYTRAWSGVNNLGLLATTGLGAYGLLNGQSPWLMLIGVTGALICWDLGSFGPRLNGIKRIEDVIALKQAHFQRLALIGGVGFLLSGLAFTIRISLGFSWVVFLGLLLVGSLSWVMRSIRRAG